MPPPRNRDRRGNDGPLPPPAPVGPADPFKKFVDSALDLVVEGGSETGDPDADAAPDERPAAPKATGPAPHPYPEPPTYPGVKPDRTEAFPVPDPLPEPKRRPVPKPAGAHLPVSYLGGTGRGPLVPKSGADPLMVKAYNYIANLIAAGLIENASVWIWDAGNDLCKELRAALEEKPGPAVAPATLPDGGG